MSYPDATADRAGEASPYVVEITDDPTEFLAAAEPHLALDPVLTTVVSTVTHRAARRLAEGAPRPSHPQWWAVVRDEAGEPGDIVGVAMRTAPFAPHPLFLLPMPDGAARALALALVDRGEEVAGANGCLPATRVFADEVSRLTGGEAAIWEHTRLFELGELVEPAPVPGALRPATTADLDLCLAWFTAFAADAAEQAGRTVEDGVGEHVTQEDVLDRIEHHRVWLWEVDGTVVHLTGANPPSFGVARVGPVYTPGEHRGRGYASAAVAAVSRLLLDGGSRVCLFTDQANPTSNKIYQALGYRAVVDMANLAIR
ncbi:GNAT superfamily N-acetyltransferase [Nocardioides ginsengisegetis]|uniref:GNAT superfamily N-acetyltransferase n=1 Tax=Nocardioides ginsengisegetis TaxID=661491 RepID=A0A7W3PA17_9ACTN|nr:GNAT family N-acetyltransferase [Nocardioides ginsengisegetis]MBA8804285.1 GNAT superfamily N-acetyltransferase [Nocardioides ginsengisegetis]